jgi:hypothetical protein
MVSASLTSRPAGHWRRCAALAAGALCCLALMACAGKPASPTATTAATAAAPATLTATPVAGVEAAEPPTTLWRVAGVEPYCLQRADVNNDGEQEWVGLAEARDVTSSRVVGFVQQGASLLPLGPGASAGDLASKAFVVADVPSCEVLIRDVNIDGLAEILVFGDRADGSRQLSIFAWDGKGAYGLLASFAGSGVRIEGLSADSAATITVRNRLSLGVLLEETSGWSGKSFVSIGSRYISDADYAGSYPTGTAEQALIAFYLNLQRRDLASAYKLLSPAMRQRQTYDQFIQSVAGVGSFELGQISVVQSDAAQATLRAALILRSVSDAQASVEPFAAEWRMVRTEAGWRVDGVSLVSTAPTPTPCNC